MNEIVVGCPDPACAHEFSVPGSLAWRRVRCPGCLAEGSAILADVRRRMRGHKENPLPPLADNSVVAVLEDIRSVHNVGSILRTCDAFGVDLVVMTGISATPEHQKIARTALGAEKTVRWAWRADAATAVAELEDHKIQVVALEHTETASTLSGTRLSRPFALVVGNEVGGVSSPVLERASRHVSIPMLGAKTSLNAAVAFAVALWQLRS